MRKWISGGVVLLLLAGLIGAFIKPDDAYYKWSITEQRIENPDLVHLERGITSVERFSAMLRYASLSYRLEGPQPWAAGDRQGCNDAWTITGYTIFGIQLGKAEVLCDGVDMRWI